MPKRTILLLLVAVAAAAGATASPATTPGTNGKIAFRRYFDKSQSRGAIFVVNPDGSGLRQVTHPPEGIVDDQPDWSSDGSLLVFSSNRDKVGRSSNSIYSAIYTVRPGGSDLTRVSSECESPPPKAIGCPYDFQPVFSHGKSEVVFTSGQGVINAIGSDGQNERVLVRATTPDSSHTGYTASDPQLSPDGSKLLFVRENRGALKPKNAQAIFVATSKGKKPHRVTPWALAAGDNPDWSPDGRWILFHSNANSDKQAQIYMIHPDGSGLKQLTQFEQGTIVTSSSFSPDGKWIVYGSTGLAGQADLFVMRSDGSGKHPITHTKLWESAPDWGPAS